MDTRDVAYRRSWRDYAAGMLRGAGQVMLQESWLSGVLFCAGLLWGCFGPGASCPAMLGLGGLAGLAIATCVGYLCGKVSDADRGLYGFNGMLAGCALGALAGNGIAAWGAIAVASVLTLVLRRWLERRMQPLGLSSYTAPFIIAVWLILPAAQAVGLWEPAAAGCRKPHSSAPSRVREARRLLRRARLSPLHLCGRRPVFLPFMHGFRRRTSRLDGRLK